MTAQEAQYRVEYQKAKVHYEWAVGAECCDGYDVQAAYQAMRRAELRLRSFDVV